MHLHHSFAQARLECLASLHARCRLQELESQHKSYQQEQEAAEFEKLQMKFGFSDKVSTLAPGRLGAGM